MDKPRDFDMNRRDLLKLGSGLLIASAAGLRPETAEAQAQTSTTLCAGQGIIEVFPTSPQILNPFSDPLPIPLPLKPVPWQDLLAGGFPAPGPGAGQQDSFAGTHQVWPTKLGLPDPEFYRIQLQVTEHSITTSPVLPIDKAGYPVPHPRDGKVGPRSLPGSTIYGFNGTFPGPMIYAKYGQPSIVRFENQLEDEHGLDCADFGAPNRAFLTHLHNGHTAPESDGNPHYRPEAYQPGQYVDNLYLNYPAGGDDNEKQSFFWFHDHKMDHTGADVYKGMVGIYPIYDPKLDPGDETKRSNGGLGLPGVPNKITGRVDYDIPLVFYDCNLDDGVTPHQDWHTGCGETHPEWWGKTFFKHFPDHGFVGDIFTVNGTAYPTLEVKRRKYRFRTLDASISRIYEFKLMSSRGGPVAMKPGKWQQGQYLLPDGQQSMRFTQIANDGGLLPFPVVRDSLPAWPAKRKEVVIDFTRYMDGTPTTKGDVVYLVNVSKMTTGRMPDSPDPRYMVPVLKFVIGDIAPDNSVVPPVLRPLPAVNLSSSYLKTLPQRTFELQRGNGGGENEWLINGLPFDPRVALGFPKMGRPEVWTCRNGGGGWVHPLHLHMEEHRVISRNGVTTPGLLNAPGVPPSRIDPLHPDDLGREDVIALGPSETVVLYRNFRTFNGPYVAHCHNLAHEDHAMMFGWKLLK